MQNMEKTKTTTTAESINWSSPPKNYGWICPVCGRGNSPFTSTCPCRPIDYRMTCGPQWYVNTTSTSMGGTVNETR